LCSLREKLRSIIRDGAELVEAPGGARLRDRSTAR